ncbi:altronate oxidoreductase [Spirochaetia bacterium]|nr:altronate oxidoreductase [Spirochaetia bacterium]
MRNRIWYTIIMKTINEAVKTVKRPERILQYGEGNFLRAFVDWQVDILNEKTGFNGNVVVVQPLERGMADAINNQQGLYTTVLRGVQDGKTVEEFRTVNSISRCLNVYAQFDEYLKCAENPDLRFVFSNTTEAGIAYNGDDKLSDKPQRSFPGKVCAFLYRRFEHFHGDPSKSLIFIPCELIDKNGDKLREIVERYAAEWKLGADFIKWLGACGFCNSLVDRIVPGYPKEEAEAICQKIGYTDNLLDAAEIFLLWVIESKKDYSAELPFAKAGINVIWTDDMSFYRTRKVRILNGAHTSSVIAAFLYGLDTVEECIKDKLIYALMRKCIFDEIIPSMDGDTAALTQYANDVLERFANPYIRHLILSITLNSVSKFKTRVLPSITSYLKKKGAVPPALSFSLAALIAFYNGRDLANGELKGSRKGEAYPIKDDEDVLKRFAALYAEAGDSVDPAAAQKIVHTVLGYADWWGEDLIKYPELEAAVSGHLAAIRKSGIAAVIGEVTGSAGGAVR